MRLVVVAVVVTSLAIPARADTISSSSIVPPEGWTASPIEDSIISSVKNNEGILRADGRQWAAPDGVTNLIVLEMDAAHNANISTSAMLEGIEEGVRSGIKGKQIARTRTTAKHKVVIDEVVEVDGSRSHMRRIYAADAKGVIYLANASCNMPIGKTSDVCDAALATLVLDVEAVAIESRNSYLYLLAKIGGGILAVVLVGLLITKLVSRR